MMLSHSLLGDLGHVIVRSVVTQDQKAEQKTLAAPLITARLTILCESAGTKEFNAGCWEMP